mgnify:CR=1 FL=1
MESSAREHKASSKKKENNMDISFVIAVIEKMIADLEGRIKTEENMTSRTVLVIKRDAYKEILAEVEPMANV